MATVASDSSAPLRIVKRVQFGILSPDELVCFIVLCMIVILCANVSTHLPIYYMLHSMPLVSLT